jgi:hypothetical protein
MKSLKIATIMAFAFVLIASCKSDDDLPTLVNEEELITTVNVTMISNGNTVVLQSKDLDGDGPNAPVTTVSGNFQLGSTYIGTVEFLDESQEPAENITEEVEAEAEEHQVFFLLGGGLDGMVTYSNNDSNGNPLGTEFSFVPEMTGSGTFTVVLRHEPIKPNDGTLTAAGGETDVTATFEVTIE